MNASIKEAAEWLYKKSATDWGEHEWRLMNVVQEAEALEAAIKRQAGAAVTLRNNTLAEVQHLKDMDRSEYNAAKTLDGEREANAILTSEVEALEAENARLRYALRAIGNLETWPDNLMGDKDIARAALMEDTDDDPSQEA